MLDLDYGIETRENEYSLDSIFTYEDAEKDVMIYLSSVLDCFFEDNETTREAVLDDEDLLNKITEKHYYCVISSESSREWSCEDACASIIEGDC